MHVRHLKPGALAATVALSALVAAGCGSSSSDSSDASTSASTGSAATTAAPAGNPLGTPKPASGKPLTFGLLNLESGPVTFPEYRQAAEAAVKYVNAYKGGIGGRPMKIVSCATDGEPSTSARCAGQVLDKKPVAILGGADTGNPGAQAVYKRANIAYLGGIPFTPVESNSPNAAEFISVAGSDLAATVQYAQKQGAKKLTTIYTNDTQGKAGLAVVEGAAKGLGLQTSDVGVAPSASDLSSVAASAVSKSPDAIFIDSPNACPGLLKALKSVGNTAKLLGIDVCASPQALSAAGDSAEGLTFSQPFPSPGSANKDVQLFLAAVGKYAPKDIALDSISQAGFSSVMNIQAALDPLGASGLKTSAILKAVKTTKDAPNFMAHPYDCASKPIKSAVSVCNAYQIVKQVKGGKVVAPDGDTFVTAAQYLK